MLYLKMNMPPAHMQLSQSSLLLENFDARDRKELVRNVAEFEKGFGDAALSYGKALVEAFGPVNKWPNDLLFQHFQTQLIR